MRNPGQPFRHVKEKGYVERIALAPVRWGLLIVALAGLMAGAWYGRTAIGTLFSSVFGSPKTYGQLSIALLVTVLAVWLIGKPLMGFIGLRFTRLSGQAIWRWPRPVGSTVVWLLAIPTFLLLAWAAGLLFELLAPTLTPPLDIKGAGWWAWLRLDMPTTKALDRHWWAAAWLATRLAPAITTFAAAWIDVNGTVTRLRDIVQNGRFEAPGVPLPMPAPARGAGRAIAVFCDGTGNSADKLIGGQPALTNVCKLHRGFVEDERQIAIYLPGVGSGQTSSERRAAWARDLLSMFGPNAAGQIAGWFSRLVTLLGNGLGTGITANVTAGYAEIVRQYQPGDRIYLFGFSRGAYTARCIAGVISRCGLLRAGNYGFAPDVVRLYLARVKPANAVPIRPILLHPPGTVAVEMLGVFDTVASLGLPLWGWTFNIRRLWSNRDFDCDPAPIIRHVFHAMSMDERRSQFFPTPFTQGPANAGTAQTWNQTLEQVWFRGAHADVGGGYVECGLSDIALEWMLDAAEQNGLSFTPALRAGLKPDPLAPRHDELTRSPVWRIFGSWPRWHPVPDHGAPVLLANAHRLPGTLHPTVLARADAASKIGRLDLQEVPADGTELAFRVEAHREWDRSGIILRTGCTYRITWQGDQWRDALKPPCGPQGQEPRGLGDAIRWFFAFRRRMPWDGYMALCATVAGPREWPLMEFGVGRALQFLFVRDPPQLRRQVVPLGRGMAAQPRPFVWLTHQGEPGLLYLFANDLWQTAGNNSGGLDLSIAVETDAPGTPHWQINRVGFVDHVAASAV